MKIHPTVLEIFCSQIHRYIHTQIDIYTDTGKNIIALPFRRAINIQIQQPLERIGQYSDRYWVYANLERYFRKIVSIQSHLEFPYYHSPKLFYMGPIPFSSWCLLGDQSQTSISLLEHLVKLLKHLLPLFGLGPHLLQTSLFGQSWCCYKVLLILELGLILLVDRQWAPSQAS